MALKCPRCKSLHTHIKHGIRERKRGYVRIWECESCSTRFSTIEEYCSEPMVHREETKQKKKEVFNSWKGKEKLNENNDNRINNSRSNIDIW